MPSCDVCQKTFKGLKHLRRHQLTHGNSRPFECGVCSKAFARKDGLQRHESIHQAPTTLVQIKGRACAACVSAKSRCTGTLPCSRCLAKDAECTYPSRQQYPMATPGSQMPNNYLPAASDPLSRHPIAFQDNIRMNNQSGPNEAHSQQVGTQHNNFVREEHGQPPHVPSLRTDPLLSNHTNNDSQNLQNSVGSMSHDFNENFAWDSNQSSTINWLQMEAVPFDYLSMGDIFPTASMGAFGSPNSWQYSVASPVLQGTANTRLPAISEANSSSPQEAIDYAAASNATTADTERGSYYVDGDKARQTRHKRRRLMSFNPSSQSLQSLEFTFALCQDFPPVSDGTIEYFLTERQHEQLKTLFQSLCVDTSFFHSFSTIDFPSRDVFHRLILSYLESFHQSLPFLHRPTFRGHDRHYALLLAMSALGAKYLELDAAVSIAPPLLEFLRRVLVQTRQAGANHSISDYEMAQVQMLYAVAARYSRSGQPQRDATVAIRECTSTFDTVFSRRENYRTWPQDRTAWLAWLQEEELMRTKFCIWLVDCIMASHIGCRPVLNLADIYEDQLPCTESLWTAESWTAWDTVKQKVTSEPPDAGKALQDLYIEKQMSSNLGEFARVLVVHGLYHRTWDVRDYFQQRLSHFEPSAQRQSSADVPSPVPVWHPKMETYSNWRNAALDCIDILHWNANAVIGLAQGMEHPTVLHLHFSRIVLLCPVKHVLRLAQFLSQVHGPRRPPSALHEAESDLRVLQQWVIQDQYKARLATIHAGAVFWHVRRYSTGAFYEPECVALASLVLWAHSRFLSRNTNQDGTETASDVHVSNHTQSEIISRMDCDIILLDRPTDDELVQQYVREGNHMLANMKGVGDLFGPHGARRVLSQGRMLLSTLGVWQEARTYWVGLLTKLEQTSANSDDT